MKKQFTTPEVEILKTPSATLICASVNFGNGETDVMHAQDRIFDDF